MKFLVQNKLPEVYPECIFVVIEDGKMVAFADSKEEVTEPKFPEFRETLARLYGMFNEEERRTLEYSSFPPKSDLSPQKGEQVAQFLPNRSSIRPHRYIYNPSQKELDQATLIIKAFNQTLQQQILDLLPKDPVFCSTTHVISSFLRYLYYISP